MSEHSAATAELTVGEYRVAYILGPELGYYAPGSTTWNSTARLLAKLEGAALERPLVEMFSSVAVNGTQTRVGDYLAVVAIERAEVQMRTSASSIRHCMWSITYLAASTTRRTGSPLRVTS